MDLTTNEIDVINGIAYHEMAQSNSTTPEDISDTGTFCWTEDFSPTLDVNQIKGVLSSLVKKDLVIIDTYKDDDTTISFTDAGFAAWQLVDLGSYHNWRDYRNS